MSIGLAIFFLYCHAGSASRPVKQNIFGSEDSRRKEKVKNKKAKEFLELRSSVFGFIVDFTFLLLACSGAIMGILEGKKAVIFGVANDRSIAWAISEAFHAEGAELAFTYAGEVLEKRVRPLAEGIGAKIILPCDV